MLPPRRPRSRFFLWSDPEREHDLVVFLGLNPVGALLACLGFFVIAALAYRFARRHAHDPRFAFGTGKLGELAGFASAVLLFTYRGYAGLDDRVGFFVDGILGTDNGIDRV